MSAPTPGERFTAAISTVVAVALLGAAVAGQQARAPIADRLASLEADVRYQIDLALRDNAPEMRRRVEQLEKVLAAWRQSSQSDEDARALAQWLRAAIGRTMPGRLMDLPAPPQFSSPRIIVAITPPVPFDPHAEAPLPTSDEATAIPADVPEHEAETPIATAAPDETALPPNVTAAPPPVGEAPVVADEPVEFDAAAPDPAEPAAVEIAALPEATDALADAAPTLEIASSFEAALSTLPESGDDAIAGPPPRVGVNLHELNARIAGYHDALAEVETAALAARRLSFARLERLVARLEQLAVQWRFVSLYHGALTPEERRYVPAPRPMDDVIAYLQRRLAEATGDDMLADFDANRQGADALAARLRAAAAEAGVAARP